MYKKCFGKDSADYKPPDFGISAIITSIVLSAVMFVASMLLAPKPDHEDAKPGALDDFGFPTAIESRSIPVSWGTNRILAPNVIWYGDLNTKAIMKDVGFIGSDWIVTGHQYYVGFDLALCYGPIDGVSEIRVEDTPIYSCFDDGPVTGLDDGGDADGLQFWLDGHGDMFGGWEKGGGMWGAFRLYNGNANVNPSQYLQDVLPAEDTDLIPGYNGVARLLWEGGCVGERPSFGRWEAVVHRYPNPLNLTSGRHVVNAASNTGQGDANPANCLYELLTNSDFGLNLSPADIDVASFVAAGNTLYTEGNGLSYLIQKVTKAETVATELLRQMGGVLVQANNGKMTLELTRQGYSTESLPEFDESNIIEVKKYTKKSWAETQNTIHIEYVDREDDFKQSIAPAFNMGNISMQSGQQNLSKLKFPGVKTKELAAQIAQRELDQSSIPLIALEFDCTRAAEALVPGDVFKVTYDEYGIDELVCRVTDINKGNLTSGKVTIKATQDIYGTPEFINFIGGENSLGELQSTLPVKSEDVILDGVPAALSRFISSDTDPGLRGLHLVSAPNGVTNLFTPYHNQSGNYIATRTETPTTPTLLSQPNEGISDYGDIGVIGDETLLANTLVRESDVYLPHGGLDVEGNQTPVITMPDNNQGIVRFSAQSEAQIKEYGFGLIQMGNEIMAYESVDLIDITTGQSSTPRNFWDYLTSAPGDFSDTHSALGLYMVHRGLLDTDIEEHPYGTKVWFLDVTDLPVDLREDLVPGTSNTYKHQTQSGLSVLDLADADVYSLSAEQALRPEKPLRPANVKIQGNAGAASHGVDTGTSDITVSWGNQNFDQSYTPGLIMFQDDVSLDGTEYPVTVEWQLETSSGSGTYSTILTNITTTGATSDTVTHAAIMTAAGWTNGDEADHNMRVKLTRKNTGHAEAGAQIARAIPYRDLVHRGDS
jgi:hypothetical protein